MNKDDLKARLEAQRQWRVPKNTTPAQRVPKRMTSGNIAFTFYLVVTMAAVIISVFIGFFSWKLSRFMKDVPVPSSMDESVPTTTEGVPTAAIKEHGSVTMMVCAGGFESAKLHVRFKPGLNSDVRGYLSESEEVLIPLNQKGKPITDIDVDGVSWTYIQLPITGWVSTSHLCQ